LDDFFSYFVYDTELILLLRLQKLWNDALLARIVVTKF
jgi:hypothetical protein